MKNRKVLNLRTHIGGLHGKTSYDFIKDKAEMELWPVGVYINSINGNYTGLLIPYSNCTEVQLGKEVGDDEIGSTEKRGPGRPPGPRSA